MANDKYTTPDPLPAGAAAALQRMIRELGAFDDSRMRAIQTKMQALASSEVTKADGSIDLSIPLEKAAGLLRELDQELGSLPSTNAARASNVREAVRKASRAVELDYLDSMNFGASRVMEIRKSQQAKRDAVAMRYSVVDSGDAA